MTDLAILEISDGVTTVDLLKENAGVHLVNWTPAIATAKGGGVFQSSSLAPSRRLVNRVFGNAIEQMTLHINAHDQDALIFHLQELLRLLEKAVAYWLTDWSNVTIDSQLQNAPVWLKAQANCETNVRYALIHYYQMSDLTNPYAQPFFSASNIVAMNDIALTLERGHWLANQVDTPISTSISSTYSWIYEASWALEDSSPAGGIIAMHTAANGYLYAIGGSQIWRSTDDGTSWTNTAGGAATSVHSIGEAENGHLFVGDDGFILRSTDNGASWSSITTLPSSFVRSIVRLANGTLVASDSGTNTLYQSTDNGATWTSFTGDGLYSSTTVTGMFRTSSNTLLAKSLVPSQAIISRSEDGGANWTDVFILSGSTVADYDRFVQLSNGTIITSDSGFDVISSIDDGKNWSVRAADVATDNIFHIFLSPAGILYAGTGVAVNTALYKSQDNGFTWSTDNTFTGLTTIGGMTEATTTEIFAGVDTDIYGAGDSVVLGGEATTESVFVSNKQNIANLTHVKIDDGGVFSDIYPITSFPQELYPATPAVDDAIYFGISDAVNDDGPFTSLVFDIGTAMVGDTAYAIVWEYYDGSGWTALRVTDNTANGIETFRLSGVRSVHWVPPGDWTQTTVDSINAYWVRARISSITGSILSVPTQQNRNIYTVSLAYSEVAASAVGGDIPALTRLRVRNQSSADGRPVSSLADGSHDGANNVATLSDSAADFVNDGVEVGMFILNVTDGSVARITAVTATTIDGALTGGTDNDWDTGDLYLAAKGAAKLWSNRLLVGLRSYDRGVNFSSYLSCSDEQLAVGTTVTVGANTTFVDDVVTPRGRAAEYSPTGAESMATRVTITLDAEVARDYYGVYHAFLRVRRTSVDDFSVQLQIVSGSGGVSFTTESKQPQTAIPWEAMDFGRITIPASGQLGLSDLGDQTEIRIQASAAGASPPDLRFYDLVLIPVDEWSIDSVDFANTVDSINGTLDSTQRKIDIDSVSMPRIPINTLVREAESDLVVSVYNPITSGQAILQANERQRLWFLAMHATDTGTDFDWLAEPWLVHSVEIAHNARYLGLRGDR